MALTTRLKLTKPVPVALLLKRMPSPPRLSWPPTTVTVLLATPWSISKPLLIVSVFGTLTVTVLPEDLTSSRAPSDRFDAVWIV